MNIHFKKVGHGPPLIMMHGLFGSLENLLGTAKSLSEGSTVYLLDARNHGSTTHSDLMDYPSMASDIVEFMDLQGLETANLFGYSMGGKVMMQAALNYPDRVDRLVVTDVAPVTYTHSHDELFQALFSLDLTTLSSRSEADRVLCSKIPEARTRLFVLKNLIRNEKGLFRWRINLEGIFRNYPRLMQGNDFIAPFKGETLFLKGENSDYLKANYRTQVLARFPNAAVKVIKNTSHWLHVEKPKTFSKLLKNFLKP